MKRRGLRGDATGLAGNVKRSCVGCDGVVRRDVTGRWWGCEGVVHGNATEI